ncbi:transport protein trapp [Anaeramoeba flamelloides]|uniref:Transport protein trapp n=1 Tax=Anaeramoeba flamelloides TaxID=1746091 RepID=A0AAV8A9F7_9EUKA|nr:transport protein trapp [Anaeramoeba flamelloides]
MTTVPPPSGELLNTDSYLNWIQCHYSPIVMVACSSDANKVCQRNGLSFVDMLRAVTLSKMSFTLPTNNRNKKIDNFHLRFLPIEQIPKQSKKITNKNLKEIIKNSYPQTRMDLDDSICKKSEIPAYRKYNKNPTPWFSQYRREMLYNLRSTNFDPIHHPVACITVISSEVGIDNAINTIMDLFDPGKPPKFMSQNGMDIDILHTFIVLHDQHLGDIKKANKIHKRVSKIFGGTRSFLLQTNSIPTNKTVTKRENIWSKHFLQYPIRQQTQVILGCRLGEQDVKNLSKFTNDYSKKILLDHMSKKIGTLIETISSSRKWLRSRMFGFLGKKTPTPDTLPNNNSSSSGKMNGNNSSKENSGLVSSNSVEFKIRLLADYFFLTHQYEQALSYYKTATESFKKLKAWKWYASSNVMLYLSTFLVDGRVNESFLDLAIKNFREKKLTNKLTESLWISADLLCLNNKHPKAANNYIMASTEAKDLSAALSLEQAAHCFIKSNNGYFRKFLLHLLLAGHRYGQGKFYSHAIRCYSFVLNSLRNKNWIQIEDHVYLTLAKHSFQVKEYEQAVLCLNHLISKSKLSESKQASNIKQFLYYFKTLSNSHQMRVTNLSIPEIDSDSVQVYLPEDYVSSRIGRMVPQKSWEKMKDAMKNTIKQTPLNDNNNKKKKNSNNISNGTKENHQNNNNNESNITNNNENKNKNNNDNDDDDDEDNNNNKKNINSDNNQSNNNTEISWNIKKKTEDKPRVSVIGEPINVKVLIKNPMKVKLHFSNVHLVGYFNQKKHKTKLTKQNKENLFILKKKIIESQSSGQSETETTDTDSKIMKKSVSFDVLSEKKIKKLSTSTQLKNNFNINPNRSDGESMIQNSINKDQTVTQLSELELETKNEEKQLNSDNYPTNINIKIKKSDNNGNSSGNSKERNGNLVSEKIDLVLAPGESKLINLKVTPLLTGLFHIYGIELTFGNLLVTVFKFNIKQKRLVEFPEHKLLKLYLPNHKLTLDVIKKMPLLTVGINNFPSKITYGSTHHSVLELNNIGKSSMKNIYLKMEPSNFIVLDSPLINLKSNEKNLVDEKNEIDLLHNNNNELASSNIEKIPIEKIEPGQTVRLNIFVRGYKNGTFNLKFMFYYQNNNDDDHHQNLIPAKKPFRISRLRKRLTVNPSISLTTKIIHSPIKTNQQLLIFNISNLTKKKQISLVQITTISKKFKILHPILNSLLSKNSNKNNENGNRNGNGNGNGDGNENGNNGGERFETILNPNQSITFCSKIILNENHHDSPLLDNGTINLNSEIIKSDQINGSSYFLIYNKEKNYLINSSSFDFFILFKEIKRSEQKIQMEKINSNNSSGGNNSNKLLLNENEFFSQLNFFDLPLLHKNLLNRNKKSKSHNKFSKMPINIIIKAPLVIKHDFTKNPLLVVPVTLLIRNLTLFELQVFLKAFAPERDTVFSNSQIKDNFHPNFFWVGGILQKILSLKSTEEKDIKCKASFTKPGIYDLHKFQVIVRKNDNNSTNTNDNDKFSSNSGVFQKLIEIQQYPEIF